MKIEGFSDENINRKMKSIYGYYFPPKQMPKKYPKYNGPRKDADMTPLKKATTELIPKGKGMLKVLIPPGRGVLKPKMKPQLTKRKIQTSDGYMLI